MRLTRDEIDSDRDAQDTLLTVTQVAELLGISAGACARLITSGQLGARRRSGTHSPWLVRASALDRFIEAAYEKTRLHVRPGPSGGETPPLAGGP